MPKIIHVSELDSIVHKLQFFPYGASLSNLMQSIDLSHPKRTLQRRLALLVRKGRVAYDKRRYFLITPDSDLSEQNIVSLSPKSVAILKKTRNFIKASHYRSYDTSWLNNYIPNQTFYLSATRRALLQKMGEDSSLASAAQILQERLKEAIWNSVRLEGFSYSKEDVYSLLERGFSSNIHNEEDRQEILNHKEAFLFLLKNQAQIGVNPYTICNIHAILAYKTKGDSSSLGEVQNHLHWIGSSFQNMIEKAKQIKDPFEKSFFLFFHLLYLAPFASKNRVVARMLVNLPLLSLSCAPFLFHETSANLLYISAAQSVAAFPYKELLLEFFLLAYKDSSVSIGKARENLTLYQKIMKDTIARMIQEKWGRSKGISYILAVAKNIPEKRRFSFISDMEKELSDLHEGNIGRFGISSTEFQDWQKNWS